MTLNKKTLITFSIKIFGLEKNCKAKPRIEIVFCSKDSILFQISKLIHNYLHFLNFISKEFFIFKLLIHIVCLD